MGQDFTCGKAGEAFWNDSFQNLHLQGKVLHSFSALVDETTGRAVDLVAEFDLVSVEVGLFLLAAVAKLDFVFAVDCDWSPKVFACVGVGLFRTAKALDLGGGLLLGGDGFASGDLLSDPGREGFKCQIGHRSLQVRSDLRRGRLVGDLC